MVEAMVVMVEVTQPEIFQAEVEVLEDIQVQAGMDRQEMVQAAVVLEAELEAVEEPQTVSLEMAVVLVY